MALRDTLKGRRFTPTRRPRRIPTAGKGQTFTPARKPRAVAPRPGAFSPYQYPTSPPPGTYDPALDAQVGASARGFGDLQDDTTQANSWSLSDKLLAQGNLVRQRGEGLADILRSRQGIDRNYSRLGNTQAQGARTSGGSAGALAQALRKRTANKAIDNQPLDVSETRLGEGTDRQLGALNQTWQRGVIDRGNTLARAGRENTQFGIDVGRERFYQARGSGFSPGPPPGEYKKRGVSYRTDTAVPLAKRRYTLTSGKQLGRAAWLRHLRRRK